MDFAVHLSNRAEKSLKGIPAADQRRIMTAIDAMRAAPYGGDVVKLKGTDAFRRRVGDYRIIFSIDTRMLVVAILDILRRTTTTYR
jgi:mRNA interferase RelE/StbE